MAVVPAATEAGLDGEQFGEQRVWRECRFQRRHRVDEIRLAVDAHRRRSVERGGAQQARTWQIGQRVERRANLCDRVGEVGAQSDEGERHTISCRSVVGCGRCCGRRGIGR